MQGVDLLPPDGWLEAEVEVRQRLQFGEAARPHRGGEPAAVAEFDLCAQQPLDRLARREPAAVHPGEHLVEGLEGSGHLQVGQLRGHALPAGPGLHEDPSSPNAYFRSARCSTSTFGSARSSVSRPSDSGGSGLGTTGL